MNLLKELQALSETVDGKAIIKHIIDISDKFTRKPNTFKEVKAKVTEYDLNGLTLHDLEADSILEFIKVSNPLDDLKGNVPPVFIALNGGEEYVVYRAGHNYCRYVARFEY